MCCVAAMVVDDGSGGNDVKWRTTLSTKEFFQALYTFFLRMISVVPLSTIVPGQVNSTRLSSKILQLSYLQTITSVGSL